MTNDKDPLKEALETLETIANLTLDDRLRDSISRAVRVLCAHIAHMELKAEQAFNSGWEAYEAAQKAVEEHDASEASKVENDVEH